VHRQALEVGESVILSSAGVDKETKLALAISNEPFTRPSDDIDNSEQFLRIRIIVLAIEKRLGNSTRTLAAFFVITRFPE
jgi:hypothetical protein